MREDDNTTNNGYMYDEIAVHYKTFEELLECHKSAETRLAEIIDNTPDVGHPDWYGHKFIVNPKEDIYCLIIELYKHN